MPSRSQNVAPAIGSVNFTGQIIAALLFAVFPRAEAQTTHTVEARSDLTFSPSSLVINVGDSVRFVNTGGLHNVTSSGLFRCANGCDGDGGNGDPSSNAWEFTLAFDSPGALTYSCEVHGGLGMTGDITVVEVLPVELTSFEVVTDASTAKLSWTTASEINNAGFRVEHAVKSDRFRELGFVDGHGTTDSSNRYSFTAGNLHPGLHRFRLKQIDFDGAFEYSAIVEAVVAVPDGFLIEPAYPNPFNPSTTLRFAIAVEQQVEVTLLNSAGQSIGTLYNGTLAANEMRKLTVKGDALPSGTYLVHFDGANGLSATERITLAK